MNDSLVKPFPCKEVGCGMSFFTEDHLAVHIQAKHTKLNLEISKASNNQIFADQTPTPTRLLNNCEELRVFDDLQNINPFEEGFRRAVEDNSNGMDHSGFLLVPSSQDTLHTPQIMPPVESLDPPRLLESTPIIGNEPINNIPKVDEIRVPTNHITYSNNAIPIAPKPTTVAITHPITLLPKPSIIYATPLLTSDLTTTINSSESKTSESVKNKLKNIILSNSGVQNDVSRLKPQNIPTIIFGTAVPLIATPANLIINEQSKPAVERVVTRKMPRRSSESKGSNQKTERNRAAAKRYRNKMKLQGQALKDKFERTQREILTLRRENAELKKELLHVKSLLLLHKDCPITKSSMNIHETPQLLL